MIRLQEAITKKEMKQFVLFPFELYKNNKYWVPPIIKNEIASFHKDKNPVFKQATARFFLAYKNNKIVGRIVAIINHAEVNIQKVKKIRFGWLDMIDDIEVTKKLLEKVHEIGLANNLESIEGPMGFSNMDKVGVLTKGYDSLGTMITWYNHPYYVRHFEELGYAVEKEFVEAKIDIANIDITKYTQYSKILQERYGLKVLSFTSSKEVMPYIDEMFALFETSYKKLASFVPILDEQVAFFKEKYLPYIKPEYIKFVINKEGKLISFSILMPYFAKGLQKAKGKLFPFGFRHILKAKNDNDVIVSYLIGVHPEYQQKGVTAIVFDEFYKEVVKNNVRQMVITPQLKNNHAILNLWTEFKPEYHKERCTYTKKIH